MFSASDVKTLREKTGAGMLDCKKALEETKGDMDAAVDYLREKGIAKAAKKESRIAAEGITEVLENGNQAIIFLNVSFSCLNIRLAISIAKNAFEPLAIVPFTPDVLARPT